MRISRNPANSGIAASTMPASRTTAARRRTVSPPFAHTTRTPMTRAPGVCPVVDQNIAK